MRGGPRPRSQAWRLCVMPTSGVPWSLCLVLAPPPFPAPCCRVGREGAGALPRGVLTRPARSPGVGEEGCYLPDLFDLGAAFANQGPALASRDHQPQRHWRLAGGRTVAHGVDDVLGRKRHTHHCEACHGLGEGAGRAGCRACEAGPGSGDEEREACPSATVLLCGGHGPKSAQAQTLTSDLQAWWGRRGLDRR